MQIGVSAPVVGTTCANLAYLSPSCLIVIVTGADCRLLPTAGGGSRGELLRIAAQIHGEWVSLTGVSRGADAAGQGVSRKCSAGNNQPMCKHLQGEIQINYVIFEIKV